MEEYFSEMKVEFKNTIAADYSNAQVCNEPLFLHVENKLKDMPEGVSCVASPMAFCVEDELISEAYRSLEKHKRVIIGDDAEDLLVFEKNEGDRGGESVRIKRRSIKNGLDFFEESERVKMAVIYKHMESGVIFVSIDGVVISPAAVIGRGTVIHPNTEIRGACIIGEKCEIGPSSVVSNSTVGDGCRVISSHIYDSILENSVSVGPFSHIKVKCRIASGTKLGAFVEVKNSNIAENTAALHLTYIGDSDVGRDVNFGCGVITCNYDGMNKYRTKIGDRVFIGCNTNLVAPVTLGDGSFTAAGSTITDDLPDGSLGIARSKQTTKEGWADRKRSEGKLK